MRHESTDCLFNKLLDFRNLECDTPFVGSACKGENTEECSFHLVPCFQECRPGVTVNCEFNFLGTSWNISYCNRC
jgi:hypothetical protein